MEKKKIKIGLVPKLIIAIIVGILFGQFLPEGFCRFVVTLSGFFSTFLKFVIPLMILAYVTMGIADLSQGAGKLLLITVALAYGSTLIAGSASYLVYFRRSSLIMEEALVRVVDLCKVYNPGENEVRALDHVNLEIHKGEFVAIIGQSGSGKSTFMNMLGCLDVPTSGKYYLNGTDVSTMKDNDLSVVRNKEIGFIFQGFNLIANLTAIENVELPLIYRGIDRKTRRKLAVESLKKVGLEKRMDHKPNEMSGGQQQRVAIARAIAAKPPVILADEPTGNLDSASSREIMEILKGMHRSGETLILITHDNGIAAQAKRVVRIMDGKIESDMINEEFVEEA